jgi:cytochrome c biogenesis protein CcdA
MQELYIVLASISVVDSISITTLSLAPLATMLAGRRPYLTAASFVVGLYVSYMIMALAFLFGLSIVLDRLNTWSAYRWNNPEPYDFGIEIVLGVILVFLGWKIADKRREKAGGRELKEGISPWAAFGFGFMLNVVGFPGAVPYFAAADRINQAGLSTVEAVVAVAFFVAVFVLPLVIIVLLRAALGKRMDGVMTVIKRFFDTWGKRIAVVLMILLGIFLIIDGVTYFATGTPVVPIGWPNNPA